MDNNELQLLRGLPISLDNICKLYPLTLDEISIIGHDEFNQVLSYVLMDNKTIELDESTTVTSFEYMLLISMKKLEEGNKFISCLETITKEKITPHINSDSSFYYFGDISEGRYLGEVGFLEFQKIIRKQYFLNRAEDDKSFNPASEAVRELHEKFNKIKSQLNKKNVEVGLDLSDIVSIVSSYTPNLNILNVWDLTVYQLYHLYIRLIMKDIYDSEFQKYLQGEDPKKLKLDHWASKLKDKT